MGEILAQKYAEIIYVNALLTKRKVVVCDLDNTLWDGIIGEGEVNHFHARQLVLKSLKSKGVVLAINSKNDPAAVHWREGTLSDDDFVASAISWNPKIHGMKQIQVDLNLKTKDFVFIDDRADERELMKYSYPEIVCLDATDEKTWTRLRLWDNVLEASPDMDRTLMYKQRAVRTAAIGDEEGSTTLGAEQLSSLGLRLTILKPRSNDLKRTAELINRTNQFNLLGGRASIKEVNEWHRSPGKIILLGQSCDRFGDMGTTCVAVADCDGDEMKLLQFVLSCRVFGYGIEHAVMNSLKRIAIGRGCSRIVGRYVKTAFNAPCENYLSDNAFRKIEERWVWGTGESLKENPLWLTVTEPI
jgi:FkbH-like protein